MAYKTNFDIKKFFGLNQIGMKGYPNEELFPYAFYFNNTTIVTQNSQLVKTIKISSYLKNDNVNLFVLREKIANAIYQNINDPNLNITINLVRKDIDIVPKNQTYENFFAENIVNKWNESNNFSNEYINEIYISFIYCPKSWYGNNIIDIFKFKNFTALKRRKILEFERNEKYLAEIVDLFIKDLSDYKIKILSIVKDGDTYYSEHCKLFSNIINGINEKFPLDIYNLGYGLAYRKIKYGNDVIQVYDDENKTTFSTIISVKDFSGILLSELDKIIQLHQNLIMTQTISVMNKTDDVEEKYKELYNKYTLASEDTLRSFLRLEDLIRECGDTKNGVYNFFISQVIIQVRGNSLKELEKNIASLMDVLRNLGVVPVKESIFLPVLFWSQLPANFEFIKRQKVINRSELGIFASLCNFPTGRLVNNKWGDAVVLLRTMLNNPYFFSFHTQINGNTLIIGALEENRTKTLNFLLASATKQVKKIFYFDTNGFSNVLINVLNGKYYQYSLSGKKNKLSINIFDLPKTEENKKFLFSIIYEILYVTEDGMVKFGDSKTTLQDEILEFKKIFYDNYEKINNFKDFLLLAKDNNFQLVYNRFFRFYSHKDDYFGFIFNNDESENIKFNNNINGFDLSQTVDNPLVLYLTTSYLFQKIYLENESCEPTIIACDGVWNLFDNVYYGDSFEQLIKKLNERNIIFVGATSGSRFFDGSYIKNPVDDIFSNTILLRNMKPNIYQRKIFNINLQEAKTISVIKKDSGVFLIRHNKDMIFASLTFNFLTKSENAILESNQIIVNAMNKAKAETESEDSKIWVPKMQEIIDKYNNNKLNQKLKEQEERQIKWQESREQVNMEQANGAK